MGHLKFHFKVRNGPQSSNQNTGFPLLGVSHSQTLKAINLYILQIMDGFIDLFCAFRDSEEGRFARIVGNRNNHTIEQPRTPFDDV